MIFGMLFEPTTIDIDKLLCFGDELNEYSPGKIFLRLLDYAYVGYEKDSQSVKSLVIQFESHDVDLNATNT